MSASQLTANEFPQKEDNWTSLKTTGSIFEGVPTAVETRDIDGKPIPCLVVKSGTTKGLIPLPEADVERKAHLVDLIGQQVRFTVCSFEPADSVILSRKQANQSLAPQTWERLTLFSLVNCIVRHATARRAVVEIDGITVPLIASEVSWNKVTDVREVLRLGSTQKVKVTKLDRASRVLEVSMTQCHPSPRVGGSLKSPFMQAQIGTEPQSFLPLKQPHGPNLPMAPYKPDCDYLSTVVQIVAFGVTISLEPGLNIFVPRKQVKSLMPEVGNQVIFHVSKVFPERQKIHGSIVRIAARKEPKGGGHIVR